MPFARRIIEGGGSFRVGSSGITIYTYPTRTGRAAGLTPDDLVRAETDCTELLKRLRLEPSSVTVEATRNGVALVAYCPVARDQVDHFHSALQNAGFTET